MFQNPAHYAKQILDMSGTWEKAVENVFRASKEWNLVPASFWADVVCELRTMVASQ